MKDTKAASEIARLIEIKEPVKRLQREVAELIDPKLQDMDNTSSDKFLFSPGYYSGSGKAYLEIFARGMFSHMVGGDVDFLDFGIFSNEQIMRDPASLEYFDRTKMAIMDEMYSSGWFDHVKPSLEYAGALGTDCVTMTLNNERIDVIHWHPGDTFIGEDGSGRIDRLALRIWTTAADLFEMEGVSLPENLIRQAHMPKAARRKIVVYGYWRRLPKAEITDMPIQYKLLLPGGDVLAESLMYSMPGPAWRFERMPRTAYGSSMGINLYRDLLQSNKLQKLLMQESELKVNPPVWIPNADKDLYLEPGSKNYVNTTDGSLFPRRMLDPADMSGSFALKQEIDSLARLHFYTEFFLQLTSSTNRKTALEVQGMMIESGAQVASVVDSFERNYLNKSVRRFLILLNQVGRLPEPTNLIKNYIKEDPRNILEIDFIGPLAKARRYNFSIGKDMNLISQVFVPMAQVDPTIMDYLDTKEFLERSRMFISGSRTLIRTEDEVQQIRAERQASQMAALGQQQQGQMQQQALRQDKRPEQGSPAQAVLNGQI